LFSDRTEDKLSRQFFDEVIQHHINDLFINFVTENQLLCG